MTCESEDSLDACECIFAEELMELGLLSCEEAAYCPNDCRICATCLQLLGCAGGARIESTDSWSAGIWTLIALALVVLLAVGIWYSRRRRRGSRDDDSLGRRLVTDEFLDDLPPPRRDEPTVWLAPDSPPAQFEPSQEAAVSSQGSSLPTIDEQHGGDGNSLDEDNVWLAPVS